MRTPSSTGTSKAAESQTKGSAAFVFLRRSRGPETTFPEAIDMYEKEVRR